jgi:hypothetical protein
MGTVFLQATNPQSLTTFVHLTSEQFGGRRSTHRSIRHWHCHIGLPRHCLRSHGKFLGMRICPMQHEPHAESGTATSDKLSYLVCSICLQTDEEDFHMVVGCHRKWEVWRIAMQEPVLGDQHASKEKIWSTMLLTNGHTNHYDGKRLLCLYGLIWSVIRQFHWHWVIEERIWSNQACLSSIHTERFLMNMDLTAIDKPRNDRLMPMLTTFREDTNEPVHHLFAFQRDVAAYCRGQLAQVTPCFILNTWNFCSFLIT